MCLKEQKYVSTLCADTYAAVRLVTKDRTHSTA